MPVGPRGAAAAIGGARGEEESRASRSAMLPYRSLCERARAAELERPRRHHEFVTAGRAPIDTPRRPSRLSLVRRRATALPAPSALGTLASSPAKSPARQSVIAAALGATLLPSAGGDTPGEPGAVPSEAVVDDRATMMEEVNVAFGGLCRTLVCEQDAVEAYDAHKVYKSSTLFGKCSICFIRHLVSCGGAPAWSGRNVDSGTVIYAAGDRGSSAFVVVRGGAERMLATGGAAEEEAQPSQFFGPGDCFGAVQMLGLDFTRKETVRAKTSMHVLEVTCHALMLLLMHKSVPGTELFPAVTWGRKSTFNLGHGSVDVDKSKTWTSFEKSDNDEYTFMEERRHFEREASRLYAVLRPRSSSAPGRGGRSAHRLRAGTVVNSTADDSGTAFFTTPSWVMSSARSSRFVGNGSGFNSTPGSARMPWHDPASGASPPCTPSRAERGSNVYITDDAWKKERILNALRGEIRKDIQRGFMIGGDAAEFIRGDRAPSVIATASLAEPSGSTFCHSATRTSFLSASCTKELSPRRAIINNVVLPKDKMTSEDKSASVLSTPQRKSLGLGEDDAVEEDDDHGATAVAALDLEMLPPLQFASPRQKQLLIKDLDRQVKQARLRRRVAMRRRVASVVDANRRTIVESASSSSAETSMQLIKTDVFPHNGVGSVEKASVARQSTAAAKISLKAKGQTALRTPLRTTGSVSFSRATAE